MSDATFKHNDPDDYHERELILHDCIAEKILCTNEMLRFCFSGGFWVTPFHKANDLNKTVRTDAAQVDFHVDEINDVGVYVYAKTFFKKTMVEYWTLKDLVDAVNSGKCTLEFIYKYRTYFEHMWLCALSSKKKPYYRECQLHIPGAAATYRWNELLPDRER